MARRWLARICAAGTLVLVLGGCLRYHVDLTVSADQRVSGTVIVAIKTTDPNLAKRNVTIPPDLSGDVTVQPYDQDGYLGEKITLHRLTFGQVGALFDQAGRVRGTAATTPPGPGATGTAGATANPTGTASGGLAGPTGQDNQDNQNKSTFSFRRDGDRIRVSGVTTFPLFAFGGVGKDFDARITLTFPGDIVSTNGQRHGRTVSWQVSPDNPTRIAAVARLSDAAPAWLPLAVAGGGGLVVLLVGLLAIMLVRRRRAAVPAGAAPAFDAGEFQTFLDDRSWYPPGGPVDPGNPGGWYGGQRQAPPYPQPPGYPGEPGYPGQPTYPGEPGYPGQPDQPGQPGQGQPGQWPPSYPEPPYR